MRHGWAVFAGIDRDEDYREEIRILVDLMKPVEIQHLCWYCEVLEGETLEYVTFWHPGDDGAVYRGNARGWRRCCKHGKWICAPCSPDETHLVPGSEWHEAPPRPASGDWLDAIKAYKGVELGRIRPKNDREIRREQMGERRAVFLAIRRDIWETDEIRIIVRLRDHTTPDHLSWFCDLLEGDGLEQVGFIFRENGDVYRGDSRGWRKLSQHENRVCWRYPKDVPKSKWHPAPPRPARWDELTIIEWDEWDPREGWITCYEDHSPSEDEPETRG
jgi:hypothetical protein